MDDASSDESCEGLEGDSVRVVRNDERLGIAPSRAHGAELASGECLAFLDGHQRLSEKCLDQCAEIAAERNAIVCPDMQGMNGRNWTGHGGFLSLCPQHGHFTLRWNRRPPRDRLSRMTALYIGYVMRRTVYEQVQWIEGLSGWGASDICLAVKAFFLDIDLLHLCGPTALHRFRRESPYTAPWDETWRNHALIARVCFDERTWLEHWLPKVFSRNMTPETEKLLDSGEVSQQHAAFQELKVRPDREFWRGVLNQQEPPCLRP